MGEKVIFYSQHPERRKEDGKINANLFLSFTPRECLPTIIFLFKNIKGSIRSGYLSKEFIKLSLSTRVEKTYKIDSKIITFLE